MVLPVKQILRLDILTVSLETVSPVSSFSLCLQLYKMVNKSTRSLPVKPPCQWAPREVIRPLQCLCSGQAAQEVGSPNFQNILGDHLFGKVSLTTMSAFVPGVHS